jgi:hypothetical protein
MKPRDVVFAPEAEADLFWIYDIIAAAKPHAPFAARAAATSPSSHS